MCNAIHDLSRFYLAVVVVIMAVKGPLLKKFGRYIIENWRIWDWDWTNLSILFLCRMWISVGPMRNATQLKRGKMFPQWTSSLLRSSLQQDSKLVSLSTDGKIGFCLRCWDLWERERNTHKCFRRILPHFITFYQLCCTPKRFASRWASRFLDDTGVKSRRIDRFCEDPCS